jgi:aconitase A
MTGVPQRVIGRSEPGSGSGRDWAAVGYSSLSDTSESVSAARRIAAIG